MASALSSKVVNGPVVFLVATSALSVSLIDGILREGKSVRGFMVDFCEESYINIVS